MSNTKWDGKRNTMNRGKFSKKQIRNHFGGQDTDNKLIEWMEIYNQGVKKCVPRVRMGHQKRNE